MDFDSLNRRQLQSLCKLNKIPANITNIAMVDALKSLETVAGIEDILNPSQSETGSSVESPEEVEVMSPRVSRTSCRTSTRLKVMKTPADSSLATARRTTSRRQLGGAVNETLKTPSVSSTRKKVTTISSRPNMLGQLNECEEAVNNECLVGQELKCIPKTPAAVITYSRRKGHTSSTHQDTVQKETTVQRVYSTRRSARLTEKKHAKPGVLERERSQPVKIGSFMEEVGVTSEVDFSHSVQEKSVESGVSSIETSNESSVSSENLEESVGNFDVCISNEKVEDICNALEKLDVLVVDESDQNLMTEKDLQMGTAIESVEKVQLVKIIEQHVDVNLEENRDVGETLVLNKLDSSEEKSDQKSNSESEPEEIIMFVDEKIDCNEALNGSADEQRVHVAPEVHSDEKSGQVHSDKKLVVNDDKVVINEALNISATEENAVFVVEEHSNAVLRDKTSILSESDGIEAEAILFDTEISSDSSMLKLEDISNAVFEMKNEVIEFNGSDGVDAEAILFDTDKPSDSSMLKLEDMSNAVFEMKNEVIEFNESTNIVENSVYLNTEFPKLDDPDYNSGKEIIVKGTEENNFTNTDDLVLVNPIKQESSIDFEAPVEAQNSLTVDTVVDTMHIEHDANHEQFNHETEQKTADADEVTHDSVADLSFSAEENEFSNKGNEVNDNQTMHIPYGEHDVNREQLNQETEQKTTDADEVTHDPVADFSFKTDENEFSNKGNEVNDNQTMHIVYGEFDVNHEQLNQETEQKIADSNEVTHDSAADISFITEENEFSNKVNDVIDNRTLSNSPVSAMVMTPISVNKENSESKLQGALVEEDKSINVIQTPSSNGTSLRQLKKILKAHKSPIVDTVSDLTPITYGTLDLNNEQFNQETKQKIADADEVAHDSVSDLSFITEENQLSNKANDVIDNQGLSDNPLSIRAGSPIFVNSDRNLQGVVIEKSALKTAGHEKPISENEISLRQLKKQLKAQQSIKEGASVELISITYTEPDINSERLNQETVQKSDNVDFSFTEEENQVSNKANDDTSLIKSETSTKGMIQISGNNENIEEDKGINEIDLGEKRMSLNDISMRQLKKKLKALSIKNNKDDKVAEARPALQVVTDNQLAAGEDN
ncbi:uncharacterized protein [Rutidosis leptorrhynchoides]|uniref:uncharacterized protein n=1 Tax=Rutidosis leptorrhynchoides TaxID=125765 RepID=UPI003A98FDC9